MIPSVAAPVGDVPAAASREASALRDAGPASAPLLPAAGVAIFAALLFWWLAGERFVMVNDEGIYLDGARRIVAGQAPYRDFFVLTGPGCFWNLAAIFRFLGVTLANARLLLILDLAILAAGVFWLTAQLASRGTALVLSLVWVCLLAGKPGLLVVNHRWDSSAAVMVSLIFLWSGLRRARSMPLFCAGAAAAYSVWITPSMVWVPLAVAAWMLWEFRAIPRLAPFVSGGVLVALVGVAALTAQGAFRPMVEHLLWTARNYAEANALPYGSVPGGYADLLHGASLSDSLILFPIVFLHALPAIVPLLTAGWLTRLRGAPRLAGLLLACSAGLLLSCAPRWDLDHLDFVSPVPYVLAAAWLSAVPAPRALRILSTLLVAAAVLFLFAGAAGRVRLQAFDTASGRIYGTPDDIALIRAVGAIARPDSVFVFPYAPLLYFFTTADNPSRYSFVQPGMMTRNDERAVLADLERRPPEFVIYRRTTPEQVLRLWPNTSRDRLQLSDLENWLRLRYVPHTTGLPYRVSILRLR